MSIQTPSIPQYVNLQGCKKPIKGYQDNVEFFTSRLKIEELETERNRLEEENRSLEAKLEQATLQVMS